MPVIAGEEIARDNTCKTTLSLRSFWGMGGSAHLTPSIRQVLAAYSKDLRRDIQLLGFAEKKSNETQLMITNKKHRKRQLARFNQLINELDTDEVSSPLSGAQANEFLPEIKAALESDNVNCVGMSLSPRSEDSYTALPSSLFSVTRANDYGKSAPSGLGFALRGVIAKSDLSRQRSVNPDGALKKVSDETLRLWNADHPEKKEVGKEDWAMIRVTVKKAVANLGVEDLNVLNNIVNDGALSWARAVAVLYLESPDLKEKVDDALIETVVKMLVPSPQEALKPLIKGDLFQAENENDVASKERLSIKIQFFMGIVNAYCYEHQGNNCDFGEVIETYLQESFVDTIAEAIQDGGSISDKLFIWINNNYSIFNLQKVLTAEQ